MALGRIGVELARGGPQQIGGALSAKEALPIPRTLSVVIPSYNSAKWLPSTMTALETSLARSGWIAEIIVVDDGSTDDTRAVVDEMRARFPYPIELISQSNQGRFLARWAGVAAAKYANILLLDSRVLLRSDSLEFVRAQVERKDAPRAWNAHIETDRSTPLIGHFWDVPVFVFWGRYLRHPRPTDITTANFDRVPKGTTAFMVERSLFEAAARSAWPSHHAQLTSDDTKILRFIAQETPIRLDPGFAAIYRPRTSVLRFLSHARDRGTLFVDSYAGTSEGRSALILLLIALLPLVAAIALWLVIAQAWLPLLLVLCVAFASVLMPLLIAIANKVTWRGAAAYLSYVLPFTVAFWLGLARGVVIHRQAFVRPRRASQEEKP